MFLNQYQQRQHPYHGFRPWTQLPLSVPPATTNSTTGVSSKHLPHLPYTVPTALPYLSQEPPILQNPERVVRISECERYEQSYQPNVALAPRNGSKTTLSTSTSTTKIDSDQNAHADYHENCEHPLAMDVKIKEERPQTPSDESQSPDACITSAANVKSVSLNNNVASTNASPISPEGQSASSNEITSSTSPVPAATTTFDKLNSDSTNHSPKTITPPTNNHHISQIMIRSHHKIKSHTDLPHQTQPNDIDHHHIHHHSHRTTSQHNGTNNRRAYYHPYNRYKLNGLSSEFELSTDTDDDSLVGEADSSNNMSPMDIASEALKDVEQKDRDKVLNIMKALLQENLTISIKNAKLLQELHRKDEEIADLLQAHRLAHSNSSGSSSIEKHSTDAKYDSNDIDMITKDDEHDDKPINLGSTTTLNNKSGDKVTIRAIDSINSINIKTEERPASAHDYNGHVVKSEVNSIAVTVTKTITNSIPATIIEVGESTTTGASAITDAIAAKQPQTNGINAITTSTNTTTKIGAKSETEVIRMPLKKSVRRTPADDTTTAATVVIMQPHKLRDEARDKSCDKLDKLSRNYEKTLSSSSSAECVAAKI